MSLDGRSGYVATVGLIMLFIAFIVSASLGGQRPTEEPSPTGQPAEISSVVVRGHTIRVGDLADDVVAVLTSRDKVRTEQTTGPRGLEVTHYFKADGQTFALVFARPVDPGPYRVINIISSPSTSGTTQGEWVLEIKDVRGKVIERHIHRPAPAACDYLKTIGLQTRDYWREESDPIFRCSSPYKEFGAVAEPFGLKNNLAYYVSGDAERIHEMLLKLNVNQRHEAKQAQQELVRAAKQLAQQALNTPLPKAAEQATAAGKPWRGTVKAATLELTRENWPTGKGYDLKFLVRHSQ